MIHGIIAGGHSNDTGIQYVGGKTYKFSSGNQVFDFSGLSGGIGQAAAGDFFLAWATEVSSSAGVPGYGGPPGNIGNILNVALNDSRDNASRLDYGLVDDPATDSGTWFTSFSRTRLCAVMVFRGVDQTTPLDVASATYGVIDNILPNLPAITPSTSGALIVALGSGSAPIGAVNFDDPADMTRVLKDNYEYSTVGRAIFMAATKAWSSGAFDPAPFAGPANRVDGAAAGATIALRPAA